MPNMISEDTKKTQIQKIAMMGHKTLKDEANE